MVNIFRLIWKNFLKISQIIGDSITFLLFFIIYYTIFLIFAIPFRLFNNPFAKTEKNSSWRKRIITSEKLEDFINE